MDNDQSLRTFDSLRNNLGEVGLRWLSDQIDQQLRSGKPEIKEVLELPEQRGWTIERAVAGAEFRRRRGRKAEYPAIVEYSPQERLGLLLDGLEQLANTIDMAQHVTGFAEREVGSATVEFKPDEQDDSSIIHLTSRDVLKRAEAASRLRQLLAEIRAEL